ncbi:hypothetical protein PMIN03_003861 [Paraphaeosphaeria minitans]
MARLSAENSTEHLAALKTPDQKGQRKSSRFKEFFKSSHSHASLSSVHSSSQPAVSPLGGVENLKPGFKKVGLHPPDCSPVSDTMKPRAPEPSRVLNLEDWEKLKEENSELGHLAKMKLYKEREELKQHEEGEEYQVAENYPKESSRKGTVKAMKVLGIDSGLKKKGAGTNDITDGTRNSSTVKLVKSLHQNEDQDSGKSLTSAALAAALCDDVAELLEDLPPNSTSSLLDIANSTQSRHPSLCNSPPLEDLRINAQIQVVPTDSISNTGDALDYESVRADASVLPSQMSVSDIDIHDYRFPRPEKISSGTNVVHTNASDRLYCNTLMGHDGCSTKDVNVTETFKLGPWKVESTIARAFTESLLPFTYMVLLFAKAIQGPLEFFVGVWKILVLAVAYTGLRRIMRWKEDGSSDVLLAPLEEYGCKMKQCCMHIMETFIVTFGQATVEALRKLDAEDCI